MGPSPARQVTPRGSRSTAESAEGAIRKPTRTLREAAGAAHSMHRGPHVEEGRVRARPSSATRYGVQGVLERICLKLLMRVTVAPRPPKRGEVSRGDGPHWASLPRSFTVGPGVTRPKG